MPVRKSVALLPLPEELQAVASTQLHEPLDLEARLAGIDSMLSRLEAKGVSPSSGWLSYDPQGLALMWLRWAKWDMDKAVSKMCAMDTWMKDPVLGDVLKLRGRDFTTVWDQGFLRVLDRYSIAGAQIALVTPAKQAHLDDPNVLLRYDAWTIFRAMHNQRQQVMGQLICVSFKDFSFMQSLRVQREMSGIMTKSMKFLSACAPFKLEAVLITHAPLFFSVLYAIVQPFMTSKIKSRIQMLGAKPVPSSGLVSADVLPAAFGGNCPPENDWLAKQIAAEDEEDAAAAATAAAAPSAGP